MELASDQVSISALRLSGPPAPAIESRRSGLGTLDEFVRDGNRSGYVAVGATDLATAVAIERHLMRRAQSVGRKQ